MKNEFFGVFFKKKIKTECEKVKINQKNEVNNQKTKHDNKKLKETKQERERKRGGQTDTEKLKKG